MAKFKVGDRVTLNVSAMRNRVGFDHSTLLAAKKLESKVVTVQAVKGSYVNVAECVHDFWYWEDEVLMIMAAKEERAMEIKVGSKVTVNMLAVKASSIGDSYTKICKDVQGQILTVTGVHNPGPDAFCSFVGTDSIYVRHLFLHKENDMAVQVVNSGSSVDASRAVQDVTFIYGHDAKNVTDDNLFEFIRELEDKIKSLEAIENKPGSLEARIDKHKGEIRALVAFSEQRSKESRAG